jgi:hypothetical protein
MDESATVEIWNRACSARPGHAIGDRHLAALLTVHSITMNGGVGHARDRFVDGDFLAAASGADYLGLADVAALVRRIPIVGGPAVVDNSTYYAVVRDDLIYAAFEHRLASSHEDFDAVAAEEPDLTP